MELLLEAGAFVDVQTEVSVGVAEYCIIATTYKLDYDQLTGVNIRISLSFIDCVVAAL